MLENTFCHVPTIGLRVERELWACGVSTWQDALAAERLPLEPAKAELLLSEVGESIENLSAGRLEYFQRRLAPRHHWRLFPHFGSSVAYFDIETTGLGRGDDHITTIVLYDGLTVRHYVHGVNLADFARDVVDYRLLVTYNGKSFDVPQIRLELGCPLGQAHIDLRFVLASLGFRGGLKGCERQLGLGRKDMDDIDGYFAVLLWQDYLQGNKRALDTLLAYNALDVVNLATLMPMAYNLKLNETPFAETRSLPVPLPPRVPFKPHHPTLDALRRRYMPGGRRRRP
jgi:hypothetical protein